MKSLTSKTLAYRKCNFVHQRLLECRHQEISRKNLRRLISEYCAASPKMIDDYEQKFFEFGFLTRDSTRPNIYLVNQKDFFAPKETEKVLNTLQRTEQTQNQAVFDENKSTKGRLNAKIENVENQSKTLVYPVEGEKKVTLSFKGYNSVWQPFKEAVWADGFPDICYVEHIFHTAYLSANRSKVGRIDVPLTVGDMNFYLTIHAPYIVQRPRRKITYRQEEIIEDL